MHEVLRQRLLRKLESLPEEQIYQVLDYIEFLESKYARDLSQEATGLQRFAENLEDRLRRNAVNPSNIREAFQLISAADRALSSVSRAGREIFRDLGGEGPEVAPPPPTSDSPGRTDRGTGSGPKTEPDDAGG